jgi:energy-coupling factor transporter ATP-binding protein EcfA2
MVKFKLYFAGDYDYAMRHAPEMSVVLWPHEDKSSDAGYRIQAGMLVRMHLPPVVMKSPIAFFAEGYDDCLQAMESALRGRQIALVEKEFLDPAMRAESEKGARHWFATLQGNIEGYRTLVRAFGDQTAKEVLKVAHDVLAYEVGSSLVGSQKDVTRSEIFQRAALRSNERYFAYRRGLDVLDGHEASALAKSHARAVVSFRLTGFNSRHEVPFEFRNTALFDRRINVLIGENGVGKSQTLVNIVGGLSMSSKRSRFSSNEPFSRVIAFSAAPSKSALPGKLRSQRVLMYRHFSLSPVRAPVKGGIQLTAGLVDLARDSTRIADASRLQIFARAVKEWLPLSRIGLPVKRGRGTGVHYTTSNGQAYLPLSRLMLPMGDLAERLMGDLDLSQGPEFFSDEGEDEMARELLARGDIRGLPGWLQRGEPQPRQRQPLSSGQDLFFRFALNLCAFIEAGTLVLVDEPENHLHPTFITRLMTLLREVLQATGSFAVIATHSPFVVREVTRMDVSIMSRTDDGMPLVRHPRLQTLGASVAAVSGYVFGDETVPTLARLTEEAFRRVRGRNMDPNDEDALQLLSRELSSEAVGYIRTRLLKEAAARGENA